MAIGVLALVGTRKGLFLLCGDDDRRGWRVDGPLLDGWGVYHTSNGRLAVYRTRNRGRTWEEMSDGLAWAAVLREASAFDAGSLYFGTQSGSFLALADGDTWVEAVLHLPPILSVEVTQWSR